MLVALRGCEGRFSFLKALYNNLTMPRACNYPFHSQGLLSDSPYFLPCNLVFNSKYYLFCDSHDTCLLNMVLILYGDVLSWSLLGVKQLKPSFFIHQLSTNHEVTMSLTPSLTMAWLG